MKICSYTIDINKTLFSRKKADIYLILKMCFPAFTEEDIKVVYSNKGEIFKAICPPNSVLGYFKLSEIECFVSQGSLKGSSEVSVEIFLFIDNVSFEEGIIKAQKKIRKYLREKQLKISSNYKKIKVYLSDLHGIFNEQIRIRSNFCRKKNTKKDYWILSIEIILLIILGFLSYINYDMFFNAFLSFLLPFILFVFNTFIGNDKILTMDFEDIWELGVPNDFSDLEIKEEINEPSFEITEDEK